MCVANDVTKIILRERRVSSRILMSARDSNLSADSKSFSEDSICEVTTRKIQVFARRTLQEPRRRRVLRTTDPERSRPSPGATQMRRHPNHFFAPESSSEKSSSESQESPPESSSVRDTQIFQQIPKSFSEDSICEVTTRKIQVFAGRALQEPRRRRVLRTTDPEHSKPGPGATQMRRHPTNFFAPKSSSVST